MDNPLILVVDDHQPTARMLERELTSQSFRVQVANSGAEAMTAVEARVPDLVLLDIVLPDLSGLEVLRGIKARHDLPVIVVTARVGDDVRRSAFEAGAEEFIRKPFSPADVSESIRFLLLPRDEGEQTPQLIRAGSVNIDLISKDVMVSGRPVRLSRSEWLLLEQLARSPGEPRLYQELLVSVWGHEYREDIEYLRLFMRRLKQKLGDDLNGQQSILDYHGIGYRLNAR